MKRLIVGLLGAMALFGCGGGGGGGSSTAARVTYVNASPDAGPLAFDLNDSTKASNLAFAAVSPFSTTKSEDLDVSVRPTGSNEILWSEGKTYAANTDTVTIAFGLRSPNLNEDTERAKRLVLGFGTVDRTAPTGSRARLLLVNALVRKVGTDNVAIDFRNPENTPVVNSANLAYGTSRSIDVDSGSQTFQARQNGSDQVFTQGTFNLDAGGVYIALVSGLEDSTGDAAPAIRLVKIPAR